MPKQKPEQQIPGQQDDGTFDLSDTDVSDLPGASVPGGAKGGGASGKRVAELQLELDEAIEARKRAMADFVNYRRRAEENEVRARQAGVCGVVRSLLPVLDHIDLALGQDQKEMTIEQFVNGVQMMRAELDKTLGGHAVRLINPGLQSEFDPNEHQAVMRVETEEQPPNTIVAVLQTGYAVEETILRPATVSVAATPDPESAETGSPGPTPGE